MKKVLPGLTVLILIVAAVALVGFYVSREKDVPMQGQVEVTEYRVASKVPARIARILVKEGDFVHAGDTLVLLDAPEVEAKREQADAATAAADAQTRKALRGAREEQIRMAFETWQKAKAAVEVAQKSYERVQRLHAEGVLTAQKLDEATAQRDAAVASERAAEAQYDMAKNGAQREDIEAASAVAQRARGAVREVAAYQRETVLIASHDGEVTEIFPTEGELVGSGAPIMNVAMYEDVWVSFTVREDVLKNFQQNAEVQAEIPALGAKNVALKVYYVKDLGTYAVWKSTKSRQGYDMKSFEVRARFVKGAPQGVRAGMSVLF